MVSASVTQVKLARRLNTKKFRTQTGEFLVEGAQCVCEAVTHGDVVTVLASDEAAGQYPELVAGGYESLTEAQVRDLSDTVSPQGIFAVCRTPSAPLEEVLHDHAQLVVICSQIRDPGNLGTVIRCADAFGADGVILTEGSVDWTNPKTVRSSVGSIFHLPIVAGVSTKKAVDAAKAVGFTILASDASGEDLSEVGARGGFDNKVAWIFGNEAWGMPDDIDFADRIVRIPMWGKAESLNLSTAAAICLFTSATKQHPHR
jgi:TrmH family RNA methyltransferase